MNVLNQPCADHAFHRLQGSLVVPVWVWVFSLHESAACVPPAAPGGCATPPSQQTSCCGSRSPRRELCTQGTCDGDPVSSTCSGILCGSCARIESCRSRGRRVRTGKSDIVPPAPRLVDHFVAPCLAQLLALYPAHCVAVALASSAEAPPRAELQVASSGSDAAR